MCSLESKLPLSFVPQIIVKVSDNVAVQRFLVSFSSNAIDYIRQTVQVHAITSTQSNAVVRGEGGANVASCCWCNGVAIPKVKGAAPKRPVHATAGDRASTAGNFVVTASTVGYVR